MSHYKCVCRKVFRFPRNARKHVKEGKCSEKEVENNDKIQIKLGKEKTEEIKQGKRCDFTVRALSVITIIIPLHALLQNPNPSPNVVFIVTWSNKATQL